MTERKSIAQILEERREAKTAEEARRLEQKSIQDDLARQQHLLKEAQIREKLALILPEVQSKFINKWGLKAVVADLLEYFGDDAQVTLERMSNKLPSPESTYSFSPSQESLDYLANTNNKVALVVWAGKPLWYRSNGDCSGKRISFFETQDGNLLLFPGSNWALSCCPVVNRMSGKVNTNEPKQEFAGIQDALLHICERKMEDWRYFAPESTDMP